jgi:hypothetical protein
MFVSFRKIFRIEVHFGEPPKVRDRTGICTRAARAPRNSAETSHATAEGRRATEPFRDLLRSANWPDFNRSSFLSRCLFQPAVGVYTHNQQPEHQQRFRDNANNCNVGEQSLG